MLRGMEGEMGDRERWKGGGRMDREKDEWRKRMDGMRMDKGSDEGMDRWINSWISTWVNGKEGRKDIQRDGWMMNRRMEG